MALCAVRRDRFMLSPAILIPAVLNGLLNLRSRKRIESLRGVRITLPQVAAAQAAEAAAS